MRFEGRIKSWNDERGFGFIEPMQGGQDIFVHVKAMSRLPGRPRVSLGVSFEVELSADGRKRARNVEPIHQRSAPAARRSETPARWSRARVLAIPMFASLYLLTAAVWYVSPWYAAGYAALSVAAFLLYAIDKSAARANRWRVAESTLHLAGLMGGWPGALLAQQLLRHKTSKESFRSTFWGSVVLNAGGFVVLNSPWVSRLA